VEYILLAMQKSVISPFYESFLHKIFNSNSRRKNRLNSWKDERWLWLSNDLSHSIYQIWSNTHASLARRVFFSNLEGLYKFDKLGKFDKLCKFGKFGKCWIVGGKFDKFDMFDKFGKLGKC
jgi:hypothetical protein